ncbi:MAG: ABC transporter ATP-binding protein [Treponema sp.]|nr:ABC transporter ATP-binding protein [Treponema sp.]
MKREDNPYHKEFGFFSNLKFVLKVMKKYSPMLLFLLPVSAMISVGNRYTVSFLIKYIIDIATNHGTLQQLLITLGIFSVIFITLWNTNSWYNSKSEIKCILARMNLILEKNLITMTMPFIYTEDPNMLDCNQKASQAVGGNQQGVEGMMHIILNFSGSLGAVIAGLSIISTINFKIVILMIAIALANFFISNLANKWCKKHVWDELAPWWRKRWYMDIALGDFSYAKDIRMFGLKNYLTHKFQEINKIRFNYQKKNNRVWLLVSIASSFFWVISQVLIYIYLIRCIFAKTITIGNFTLYLSATATFFECVMSLLNSITNFLNNSRYVDDFRSFYEMPELRQNLPDQKTNLPKLQPQSQYEFEFQNVSFKYPRAERFALQNVSIKIKAGERLAVVGLNGAGKSTFIKLLLRLYQPTEGKILLNGTDIQTYDLNSYFKIFAPVFQEVNLFAMSFAENVSMKSLENTDKDLAHKSVVQSGLEEKLDSLEKGLDTQLLKVIYDDGIDLSGGQKQKLALARALYKNSPVVVLDEPTAALDAIAESKLYSDFDKLIGGKTSIYISHRLSSTQFCNNVAMFKDGKLIEYGTHESLLKQNGEYANMFKIQAQYYVDAGETNEN